MIVAIAPDLVELKNELEKLNYEVVMLGEYKYPIDAMVYYGYSPDISYVSMNNMSEKNYGILMVNAQNKSIEEIDNILKTRLYNKLF